VARPLLLRELVLDIQDDEGGSFGTQAWLLSLLGITLVLEGLFAMASKHLIGDELCVAYSTVVSTLIFEKSLTMDATQKSNQASLISNDLPRLFEHMRFLSWAPSCLASLVGGIVVLLLTVGVSSFVGMGVIVAVLLLNGKVASYAKAFNKRSLQSTDRRLKMMTQIIEGIKAIKLSAWETPFVDSLMEMRKGELDALKNFRLMYQSSTQMGRGTPVLAAASTFLYIALAGKPFEAADIFSALSVFLGLRMALIMVPLSMTLSAACMTSVTRAETFLLLLDCQAVEDTAAAAGGKKNTPSQSDAAIAVWTDATLEWGQQQQEASGSGSSGDSGAAKTTPHFALHDISLSVPAGGITAIAGPVGCGKTSLLSSLFGELRLTAGRVQLDTSVTIGLVGQSPFIINGSVKDNILFGRPFTHELFDRAVHLSDLHNDMHNLSYGMETHIGDRGITLSGGQKMRISIARAVYSEPQMLVCDDPLAAVDAIVGRNIFKRAFQEFVALGGGRSVLVALNQKYLLEDCNYIVIMKDGRICCQGPASVFAEDDAYRQYLNIIEEGANSSSSSLGSSPESCTEKGEGGEQGKRNGTQLARFISSQHKGEKPWEAYQEKLPEMKLSSEVYSAYLNSMGRGYFYGSIVVTLFTYAFMGASDRWLATWVDQKEKQGNDLSQKDNVFYATVYAALSAGFFISAIFSSAMWVFGGIRSFLLY
jgi:ABC-type multidrug transport system fused ATPase/permease subunit